MAWGNGLHIGMAEPPNFWFKIGYQALVIFLRVAGTVMWWMRRPVKATRLSAPPNARRPAMWRVAVLVGLATCLAFPMADVALLVVQVVDINVLTNLPIAKRLMIRANGLAWGAAWTRRVGVSHGF